MESESLTTPDQVNAEFEERLLANPHDWATWKVYTAWLIERGDPRGELMEAMRAAGQFARVRELIAAHWARWFGGVPPAAVGCEWSEGFVRELRVKTSLAEAGELLFTAHSLRFLRELKLDAGVELSLSGLEALRLLNRIEMPASVPLLEDLARHRPPALRVLSLAAPLSAEAVTAIRAIPGVEQLERLVLGPLGLLDVPSLFSRGDALAFLGDRLSLRLEEDAGVAHCQALRAAFPTAFFSLQVNPRRYGYERMVPVLTSTPYWAPANFRELPPVEHRTKDSIRGPEAYSVGSNIPMERNARTYARCVGCASETTRFIYSCFSTSYSERKCENYYWSLRELVCEECGMFTHYEGYRES